MKKYSRRKVATYEIFAKIYDDLGSNISQTVVSYLLGLLRELNFDPMAILDLGCGTGEAMKILSEKGYNVTGLDNSLHMLEVAKGKIEGRNTRLIEGDMRDFRLPYKVDLVIALPDVLTYLLTLRDMDITFKNVYESLEEKGLFIFDMSSEASLRMWNGTYITTRPEWRLVSEGKYYPRGHLRKMKMHICVHSKDKPIIEFVEEHVHRAYSETQIRRMLYHAKFRDVSFTRYDSRMFSDLDDEYMFKLVCIARK